MNKLMNIKASVVHGEGEVLIYDRIGKQDAFMKMFDIESVDAKGFKKQIDNLGDVSIINIRINSPGGDVFEANAIRSVLENHSARKIVHIDGLAASAASVIATCGDEVIASPGSMIMIHRASSGVHGNAIELLRGAEILETIDNTMAKIYAKKTGLDKTQILEMMSKETWMDAEEAEKLGFVDIITGSEVQAVASTDGYLINNVVVSEEIAAFFNFKKNVVNLRKEAELLAEISNMRRK